MPTIYVLNQEGEHSPYEEGRIPELLVAGMLNPRALYWKEGMSDWLPLSSLPKPPHSVAPPRRTDTPLRGSPGVDPGAASGPTVAPFDPNPVKRPAVSTPLYYARENLEPMTSIVLTMLVLCFVTGLLCLYFDMDQYQSLQLPPVLGDEAGQDLLFGHALAFGVFILTSIPFLMWVFRIKRNCRGFAPGMRFSSASAVSYFFVPFLCLVRPYQVMQDIWRVSTSPRNWTNEKGSFVVGIWWALWLWFIYQIIGRICLETISRQVENAIHLIELDLVFWTSYVVLCVMTCIMVFAIAAKQKRLLRHVSSADLGEEE